MCTCSNGRGPRDSPRRPCAGHVLPFLLQLWPSLTVCSELHRSVGLDAKTNLHKHNTVQNSQYNFFELFGCHRLCQKASQNSQSYFCFHVKNISHSKFLEASQLKSLWCPLEEGDGLHIDWSVLQANNTRRFMKKKVV